MSETKRKVPKLRFPGFTEDWEQRKLGDLAKVEMDKRIYKEQTSAEGEIPFYKIGTFGGKADSYISEDLYNEYTRKYPHPKEGDILISASGSIGRTVVYHGEKAYFQDSNIVWLNHNGALDNGFLLQFYSRVKWAGLEGSTIKRLYNKNILETEINVPDIREQKNIGEFFTQVDNLITLHQRKLENLKLKKKALLQKLFPKNGEQFPELRFPGFTDAWEQRKLGEIATVTGGGTPSTNISEYWNGDIDWYSPVEIGENRYVSGSIRKITKLGLEKSSAKILPVGTVLFTSRAGIGNTAILQVEGCTNQGFQSITPNLNELDTYFLYTMTPKLKRYGEITGAGSTFVEVSGKQMEQMNLMVPSLEEQKRVSELFKTMDDAITLHQRKLEHLQLQKKALLQQMFV